MNPRISLFLMAYNEEASVEGTARQLHAALSGSGVPFELVIIDDGSSDGTGGAADSLAASLKDTRVLHHSVNMGLGGVYRTGFSEAKGELVTFFPADGQFPPENLGILLKAVEGNDMALGYIPDRKSSLIAKALSAAEKLLYTLLFGPMPKFQGVMMFKRSLLDEFRLKSSGRGWAVLMELIIRTKRSGKRITSVPTVMRERKSGSSKVNNMRTIMANLRQVFALRGVL